VAFARLFNEEAFWDSHEALEDAWRESRSEFYHGLILYASALVHVQWANAHGVQAQFAKAARCLKPFRPTYLGVDVELLLAYASSAKGGGAVSPGGVAGAFPSIQLNRQYLRGDEPELTAAERG